MIVLAFVLGCYAGMTLMAILTVSGESHGLRRHIQRRKRQRKQHAMERFERQLRAYNMGWFQMMKARAIRERCGMDIQPFHTVIGWKN